MKRSLVLAAVPAAALALLAPAPASAAPGTFIKAFVDSKVTNNDVAFGTDATPTSDGGYIVTGSVGTRGTDGWIAKLSGSGRVQWQRLIGSGGADLESVQQTSDGGYIVAGGTNSESACAANGFSTLSCAWVIKLTATGAITWQNVYPGSQQANASQIRQASDGGYIIAGSTTAPGGTTFAWLAKLNPQGWLQWQKQFGPASFAAASSVAQTTDGGYVITGESGFIGSESVLVAKFGASGNPQWQQTYRSTGDSSGRSIQQTSDGGYVVAGSDNQGPGTDEALLLKLNTAGAVQFQDVFTPGPVGNYTDGASVAQTPDGGYVLAGTFNFTPFNSPVAAAWLVKTTAAGAVSWQHVYSSSQSGGFHSVRLTSDGGYVAMGTADAFAASNNVWLVKTDSSGNVASGSCKAEQAATTVVAVDGLAATATSFPSVTPASNPPAGTPDSARLGNLVTQSVC